MKPRSEELFEGAREALRGARATLRVEAPARATNAAYYAMLYAARTALSERDLYSTMDRGTWQLFHEQFVEGGSFDQGLHQETQNAQELRKYGDYEAQQPSLERAEEVVGQAEKFVSAIEEMLKEGTQ